MTELQRQAVSEWEKTLAAGAFAKNAELGSFGRFWAVLGAFGKCRTHCRIHIAGSLPLLHSPRDSRFRQQTPSAQDSEPQIASSKPSHLGPNGAEWFQLLAPPISYVPMRRPLNPPQKVSGACSRKTISDACRPNVRSRGWTPYLLLGGGFRVWGKGKRV